MNRTIQTTGSQKCVTVVTDKYEDWTLITVFPTDDKSRKGIEITERAAPYGKPGRVVEISWWSGKGDLTSLSQWAECYAEASRIAAELS